LQLQTKKDGTPRKKKRGKWPGSRGKKTSGEKERGKKGDALKNGVKGGGCIGWNPKAKNEGARVSEKGREGVQKGGLPAGTGLVNRSDNEQVKPRGKLGRTRSTCKKKTSGSTKKPRGAEVGEHATGQPCV